MEKEYRKNVSIIIPILNEIKHIEKCVDSVISSTNGIEDMELILVDGGSNDGTIDVLESLSRKYPFISILHNEKKMIGAGINIGIENSTGKYIVRLDAHAIFPNGYIETLIETLEKESPEIVNVGGALITLPSEDDIVAKSISVVLSSRIGVGNSPFRVGSIDQPKFVSTVPFGCYRREIFDEIGVFNENVPRSEDLELSQRIINAGKKILMIPEVSSTYFSRGDFMSFFHQQFDNGRSVTKEHRGIVSFYKLRHLIPLFFCAYILSFSLLQTYFLFDFTYQINFIAAIPLATYALMIMFSGFYYMLKESEPLYPILIPLSLLLLHVSYGIGSIYGLLQIIFPTLPSKSVR
tara:strand:- start:25865 stop:26917 length:1053 start_codon:yes stop_codon:yes gene_type:complete